MLGNQFSENFVRQSMHLICSIPGYQLMCKSLGERLGPAQNWCLLGKSQRVRGNSAAISRITETEDSHLVYNAAVSQVLVTWEKDCIISHGLSHSSDSSLFQHGLMGQCGKAERAMRMLYSFWELIDHTNHIAVFLSHSLGQNICSLCQKVGKWFLPLDVEHEISK